MALPAMASALVAAGVEVDVIATDDDGPGCRMANVVHGVWQTMPGGWRRALFPKQTEFYKASLPLFGMLSDRVKDYQLVHVHAVFSFASLVGCLQAKLKGVPYVVRPLGILNGWGMANRRRWVKRASFRLLDKPLLDAAAAMHYTSGQEQDEVASLGLRSPGFVLPLGFDVEAIQQAVVQASPTAITDAFPELCGREVVLYLSRLDEKKGLELLLESHARLALSRPAAHLLIVGAGDVAYTASLKALSLRLGLQDRVTWAGHLDGELKASALSQAKVFALVSSSENFGIALLEAMAVGLPCVSCREVALAHDTASQGAVLLTERRPDAVAAAVERVLSDGASAATLGRNAKRVASSDYTLDAMGLKLRAQYEALV
jgi:glycosyltransferase involved in cell wall biosynthesis